MREFKLIFLVFVVITLNSCLIYETAIDENLATVTLSEPIADGPLKFLVVADIHPVISDNILDRMDSFVKAATANNVDFMIQMGDFVEPEEDLDGAILAKWNEFKGNKLDVLGNHDMDRGTKRSVMNYWGLNSNCYTVDVKGFRIVVFDPNYLIDNGKFLNYDHANFYNFTETRGTVPEEQLIWLDKVISETDSKVLVFSHQSLIHPGSIKNSAEIRAIFEKHNAEGDKKVIACFNGHEHVDQTKTINGIHYMQVNSLSYQWLGGNLGRYSDEEYEKLTGRERDVIYYEDSLYAIITVESDRIIVDGVQSELRGPQPDMAAYAELYNGLPLSASIEDQVLNY